MSCEALECEVVLAVVRWCSVDRRKGVLDCTCPTPHLHLVRRLGMSGSIPLSPPAPPVPSWRTREQRHFSCTSITRRCAALRAVCWTVPTHWIGNVLGVEWCKWKCRTYKIMRLWRSNKYHVAQRGVNVSTPLYSVAPYLRWNTSVAFPLSFFLQIPLGFIKTKTDRSSDM